MQAVLELQPIFLACKCSHEYTRFLQRHRGIDTCLRWRGGSAKIGKGGLLSPASKFGGCPTIVSASSPKISAQQEANEFDVGGHAKKAKTLLDEANSELKMAAEAANRNKR